jgi:hypothetical protein
MQVIDTNVTPFLFLHTANRWLGVRLVRVLLFLFFFFFLLFFLLKKDGLALPRQAVVFLETFSFMESFLGLAAALLRFCHLAMHNKSLESLCYATQASAWGNLSRVPC